MISNNVLCTAIEQQYSFEGKIQNTPEVEAIHIGYGIDNNYVRCVGASIASICLNNPGSNLVFHVLASGLQEDSMLKLRQLASQCKANIYVYTVNNSVFSQFPVQAHFPASIYYRFILPAILPVPRVLYLDADIICQNKIETLLSLDLNENVVAAVPDLEPLASKRNQVLDLQEHIYFNSGVLFIDIEKWNNCEIASKTLTLLAKEPKKYRYPDQDVLNVVLAGKIKYLDKTWNRINTRDMAEENITFLHFAAHPKPWSVAWEKSELCTDFTKNIYRQYEDATPWQDSLPTKPKNSKEMKHYAKCLLNAGDYRAGLLWYGQYISTKIKNRIANR